MISDNIGISGITDIDEYPKYNIKGMCTEGKQCFKIEIFQKNLPIEFINRIIVDAFVTDYKIIKTMKGPKIIVSAEIYTKIIYTADTCRQSLHMVECRNNFCDIINVNAISYARCTNTIDNIFIVVQDVVLMGYDEYCIDIAVVYLLCPELQIR